MNACSPGMYAYSPNTAPPITPAKMRAKISLPVPTSEAAPEMEDVVAGLLEVVVLAAVEVAAWVGLELGSVSWVWLRCVLCGCTFSCPRMCRMGREIESAAEGRVGWRSLLCAV